MTEQAFSGIKIVDFGWVVVEPLIVKYLADHGAEVVRIEAPNRPDATRVAAPYKNGKPGVNRAGFFASINNNKYGVCINVKHPKAKSFIRKLIEWADIVAEGYTPGTLESWGLGYKDLVKIKPDIIMISTCNLGQTGPYALHPGFGTQLVAYSGLASLTGWPDGEPVVPDTPYNDALVPPFGAAAVIAALAYRKRTGQGQYLDLSQHEIAAYSLAVPVLDYGVNRRVGHRNGNHSHFYSPHSVYPCQGTDRWCAISVTSESEWEAFCQALGNPTWTKEPRFATLADRQAHEDELDRHVADWTGRFTAEEVMSKMQAAGVPAGVVQTCGDIYSDPQLQHRHHFGEVENPEMGKYFCEYPAFRLSRTPAAIRFGAPTIGQHNEFVSTKILGISDEEFVDMMVEGVFG